jgi:hypothetical protein
LADLSIEADQMELQTDASGPSDGTGRTQRVAGGIQQLIAKKQEKFNSPYAAEYFNVRAQEFAASRIRQSMREQAAAAGRAAVEKYTTLVNTGKNRLLSKPDEMLMNDSLQQIELFVDQGTNLNPDAKAKLKQQAQVQLYDGYLTGAIAAAMAPPAPGQLLTPEEADFRAKRVTQIQQEVHEGKFDALVTPDVKEGWIKQINNSLNDLAVFRAEAIRRDQVMSGVVPFDPGNSDDRKTANSWFDNLQVQWAQQGLQPDEIEQKGVEFVAEFGIVPDSMKRTVRGGLRSGDAEQKARAAYLIDTLTRMNEQAMNDFAKEDVALGIQIAGNVRNGMTPQEAVNAVTESRRITPEVRKAREEEYNKLTAKGDNKPVTALGDLADGRFERTISNSGFLGNLFGFDPSIPSEAVIEFDALSREEYARSGDMAAAQEFAARAVMRNWGTTRVDRDGSLRITKYPVERFYGVPGLDEEQNAAWIREQMIEDAKAGAIGLPEDIDNSVVLQQHPITASDSQGRPVYMLMIQPEDGGVPIPIINPKTNRPREWQPSWTASKEYARRVGKEQAAKSVGRVGWG